MSYVNNPLGPNLLQARPLLGPENYAGVPQAPMGPYQQEEFVGPYANPEEAVVQAPQPPVANPVMPSIPPLQQSPLLGPGGYAAAAESTNVVPPMVNPQIAAPRTDIPMGPLNQGQEYVFQGPYVEPWQQKNIEDINEGETTLYPQGVNTGVNDTDLGLLDIVKNIQSGNIQGAKDIESNIIGDGYSYNNLNESLITPQGEEYGPFEEDAYVRYEGPYSPEYYEEKQSLIQEGQVARDEEGAPVMPVGIFGKPRGFGSGEGFFSRIGKGGEGFMGKFGTGEGWFSRIGQGGGGFMGKFGTGQGAIANMFRRQDPATMTATARDLNKGPSTGQKLGYGIGQGLMAIGENMGKNEYMFKV